MAVVIKPTGEEVEVEPEDKRRGFTLRELYRLTECDTVDIVGLADGRRMVVDDDGLGKRLPLNPKATRLYQEGRKFFPLYAPPIVGTVLICSKREIK